MKRVFICAPLDLLNPDWPEVLDHCFEDAALEGDVAPILPHLLYLRGEDESPTEARVRLHRTLAWLSVCDEVWVYGDPKLEPRPNQVMEMTSAAELGIPVVARTRPSPRALGN